MHADDSVSPDSVPVYDPLTCVQDGTVHYWAFFAVPFAFPPPSCFRRCVTICENKSGATSSVLLASSQPQMGGNLFFLQGI